MKNYENKLRAIEKIADGKTAKVVIVDYKDGKYYQDGRKIDINNIIADIVIIDDIPDTSPEFLEKGVEENESDG